MSDARMIGTGLMQINQGSGKTPLRKMKEYDLISLRSFVAVVESGSFYNAAVQLDASSAAIRAVSGWGVALGAANGKVWLRKLSTTANQPWVPFRTRFSWPWPPMAMKKE